jgi:hypothetical protein
MNISTLAKRIVVLLVAAAATAPVALAGTPSSSGSRLGQSANVPSAQCPCNVGLPGRPDLVTLLRTPSLSSSSSRCPCNVGLPGGPAAVGHARLVSKAVSGPVGSFDWGDAGAGAGFTVGFALLVGGAALVLRRHRVLARPHS